MSAAPVPLQARTPQRWHLPHPSPLPPGCPFLEQLNRAGSPQLLGRLRGFHSLLLSLLIPVQFLFWGCFFFYCCYCNCFFFSVFKVAKKMLFFFPVSQSRWVCSTQWSQLRSSSLATGVLSKICMPFSS